MSDEDKHRGLVLVHTDDSFTVVDVGPHYDDECAERCERAEQLALGHETVYEAPDAGVRRSSVGYSKSYAAGYDAAFGKN